MTKEEKVLEAVLDFLRDASKTRRDLFQEISEILEEK